MILKEGKEGKEAHTPLNWRFSDTDLVIVWMAVYQSPAQTADCPRIRGLSADIRKHSVADAVRLRIVSCGCGADADPVV